MRPILLFALAFLISLSGFGQHHKNQSNFKSNRSVTAPRFRMEENDGDAQYQTNNYVPIKQEGNQVQFTCRALLNTPADEYLVIFNLTQVATTAHEADILLNQRIFHFTQSLKSIGIEAPSLHTDMIYLIPLFEFEVQSKVFSKTYNEVPKGFEMQKNLHIRFKDPVLLDKIVTLAAASEIYDLVSLEYFVENTDKYYDTLRKAAITQLAKNVEQYKALGMNLSIEYHTVKEVKYAVYPETQYADFDSYVSQSIDAAKNKTVTTMRKPSTVAYSKLDYSGFDIVMHPSFLVPVVQYVMMVQVTYTLKEPEATPATYYVIDPAGNLKLLPIQK